MLPAQSRGNDVSDIAVTKPLRRIWHNERKIARYRRVVERWMLAHRDVEERWLLEDRIGWANLLFSNLLDLDTDVELYIVENHPHDDEDARYLRSRIGSMFKDWLGVSSTTLRNIDKLVQRGIEIKGADTFCNNVRSARQMLTADDIFFDSDKLVQLRDEAIDANRTGRTDELVSE